jgi:hypothetical protein
MRAIFLRALGAVYLSAFWSMAVQVDGLIGSQGILPAGEYLGEVGPILGGWRYWQLPTLLWLASLGFQLGEAITERAGLRRAAPGSGDHVPAGRVLDSRNTRPWVRIDDDEPGQSRQVDCGPVGRGERDRRHLQAG